MEPDRPFLPRYKDLYFRIFVATLASHTIVVYGEPESSFKLMLTRDYYTAFAGSFLIAFLLIQSVHTITVFLDRRFEWSNHSVKRVFAQIILGLGGPGIGAILMATLYFKIRGIEILSTTYEAYDFPFILLMITLLNAYYLGYYFFLKWQHAEKALKSIGASIPVFAHDQEPARPETDQRVFYVNMGTAPIPIPFDSIAYFFRNGEANYLRTFEGEDFFVAGSLDEAELQTTNEHFFRINRQILASYQAIDRYKPTSFGKVSVSLIPTLASEVIVSQKRARTFRHWMDLNSYLLKKAGA